jgi:alkaline phosphatase
MTASAFRIGSLWTSEGGEALLKKHAGIDGISPEDLKHINEAATAKERVLWIGRLISRECGVTFIPMATRLAEPNTTSGHDGGMVPVYAYGPGAHRFTGTMENAELSRRIRRLAGY